MLPQISLGAYAPLAPPSGVATEYSLRFKCLYFIYSINVKICLKSHECQV